jgi:putative transposase
VGLSRSKPLAPRLIENEVLLTRLRELAYQHKRYGYRRIHALLRREGWQVNVKRVRRLWRLEGLQVRKKYRRKRKVKGSLTLIPQKAVSPNHVWTLDFVHDQLSHKGRIRLLTVVDEFTRECLCIRVEHSLKSEDVQATLEVLFKDYGKPLYLRSDNGSEFIARCLQTWLSKQGTKPLFIEPGSPWQNGKCESFNGRFRDECLNMEVFHTLKEAQIVIEAWRKEYNAFRPHSALGYKTPAEMAAIHRRLASCESLRTVI